MDSGFSVDMEGLTAQSAVQEDTVLGIINTCTVTGKAEQKARRIIRLMLQKLPNALVIVTGCYAELDSMQIKDICPDRITILAGTRKSVLSTLAVQMKSNGSLSLSKNLFTHRTLDDFVMSCISPSQFALYTPVFTQHSRGSLKIQDGCNCACTFCRIHMARGKSVSLSVTEALNRVQELENSGMNEVVLTGVNLSQYAGTDETGNKVSFSSLLKLMIENTNHIRFRISSFYPQSIDDRLCQILADKRVQPFFHLSIQSGSDKILKAMARPHSVEHVVRAIQMIRSAKENPFVSCDLIAGFPGEEEAEFAATQALCEEQNFAWIHAFPFSPRPGTPAKTMKCQIPERIKGERVKWLTDTAVKGKIEYINYWTAKPLSAIVENSRSLRIASGESSVCHAVTENYLHVEFASPERVLKPGELITLRIKTVLEDNIASGKEIDCAGIMES